VAVACSGDEPEAVEQPLVEEIACVVLAGTELSFDGAPYPLPQEYCSVHPWRDAPDSPYDLWLGGSDGRWSLIVGIMPGGVPDAQGNVTLEVIAPRELGGEERPGSAWLLMNAEGEDWASSDTGGAVAMRAYELAATGEVQFRTLPDGSQLVFTEITFEPALNVVSPSGQSRPFRGTVKVAANRVATPSDCPDVVPGGAECVEFNACGDTSDCTCPNTQCDLSGKCCIIGGAPCGADDECCSRYCSPHKHCAPRPAVDPCDGGSGGSGARTCVEGHDPLVAGNPLECVCDTLGDVDDYVDVGGWVYVDQCSRAECCIEYDDGSGICECVELSASNPGTPCSDYAVGRGRVTSGCP
jgi:hypothetical protein